MIPGAVRATLRRLGGHLESDSPAAPPLSWQGQLLQHVPPAKDSQRTLDVVGQGRQGDLRARARQARIRKRGFSKMWNFNAANGCSTVQRRSLIAAGVARWWMRSSACS